MSACAAAEVDGCISLAAAAELLYVAPGAAAAAGERPGFVVVDVSQPSFLVGFAFPVFHGSGEVAAGEKPHDVRSPEPLPRVDRPDGEHVTQ